MNRSGNPLDNRLTRRFPWVCESLPSSIKRGVSERPPPPSISRAGAAEAGRRVLLVDLDPQANATSGLGLENVAGKSLYPVLLGNARAIDMLQPSRHPNLQILSSELDLAGAEMDLAGMDDPLSHVRKALDPLRLDPAFDLVILDCPPSVGPAHDQRPRRCGKDSRTRPVRILRFGGGW